MPFKSKAQQRYMFAAESRGELPKGTAKKWADETEDIKNLPEKVQKEAKYLAGRAVGAREVVYGRRGGPISAETERQRAQERAKKSPRLQAIYEKLDDPSGKPLSFDKLPRETGMNKQADLRKWFRERWVDVSRKKKGGGHPPCGRDDADKGAYPKCLPAAKASKLTQKQKKSAVRRKRAGGQGESKTPKYVSTMKKQALFEKVAKNVPTNPELWSRAKAQAKRKFDKYPSAYCVPVETSEALTKEGWKSYDQLAIGELILAYDRFSDELTWTPVLDLHYFENRPTVDLQAFGLNYGYECTPNHRALLGYDTSWSEGLDEHLTNEREVYDAIQKVACGDLTYKDCQGLASQATIQRYRDVSWHEFLDGRKSVIPKFREVQDLPKDNGFLVVSAPYRGTSSGPLDTYVKYDTSPMDQVLRMSYDQLSAFLMGSIMCDGWQGSNSDTVTSYGFKQKNTQNRDAVELAAFLSGHMVTRSKKPTNNGCWNIRIKTRRTIGCSGLSVTPTGTSKDVWCPETEHGTWVMRQGATITITGNSNGWAAKWYKSKGGGWKKEAAYSASHSSPPETVRRAIQRRRDTAHDFKNPMKVPHMAKTAELLEKVAKKTAAWSRKEGKNPEGGLNEKGRKSYERQNPGSNLKPPVSREQAKRSPKSAARRKSFCARMSHVKGPMKDEKGRPTRKALALRAWDC